MNLPSAEFKRLIHRKKYLFHIHTNYTDGTLTVRDYFRFAEEQRIELLIFTEHIRRVPSYDFDSFLHQVRTTATEFPRVQYIIGVEAKVLPDGTLDLPETILKKISLVCFAYHSFPPDISKYRQSFVKVIQSHTLKRYVRIWVHPGHYLRTQGLLEESITLLQRQVDECAAQGVFIEKNLTKNLPPENIRVPPSHLILGIDAHSKEDLERYDVRHDMDR